MTVRTCWHTNDFCNRALAGNRQSPVDNDDVELKVNSSTFLHAVTETRRAKMSIDDLLMIAEPDSPKSQPLSRRNELPGNWRRRMLEERCTGIRSSRKEPVVIRILATRSDP